MSLTTHSFSARLVATDLVARHGVTPIAVIGLLHLAAIGLLAWYEVFPVSRLAFVLIWGLLNFFWLALLRRPAIAAALSLILVTLVIVLSEFKFRVLWMTLNFLDVMIIDADSFAYPIHDLSAALAYCRHRRGGDRPAAGAALVDRSATRALAHGDGGNDGLLRRTSGAGFYGADRAV